MDEDEDVSIGRRVTQLADMHPHDHVYQHVAIDGGELSLTWTEIERRSGRLALALSRLGLIEGDRLAVAIRNSPQLLLGVFSAWKLGAIPVPVRWDVPEWELSRLRGVIAPRVFLGAEDLAWIDTASDGDDSIPTEDLTDVIAPNISGICSSGSTGTPKVILTGRPGAYNVGLGTAMMDSWRPVPRPQTILVPAPMYHANGFATLFNLLAGDHLVVMEKFDAAQAVDVIERHRISTFTATPTMLKRIADLPGIDGRDLTSIEWILQGAAPMPPYLVHRWAELIGAERILMAYGMTEGLGITALCGDEWMSHEGSVGRPIRDTELRILGPGGNPMPNHEIGEIYLRSGEWVHRYLGDAEPLPVTADGFRTVGDLGYLDHDGYLYLVDRRVDVIITGGANVYPAEVETALIDHPKIADVVVVGLRDPQWGRKVHAIVQPFDSSDPPTPNEVRTYARSRLASYKIPKSVELVDVIPRTEATKVNRGALIEARGG